MSVFDALAHGSLLSSPGRGGSTAAADSVASVPGTALAALSAEAGAFGAGDQRSHPLDAANALQCRALLALARLYTDHAAAASAAATAGAAAESSALLEDAFECVYKCREICAPSWLPDIHERLAAACVQARRPGDAVRHYESALAFDATHTPSLIGLAVLENQVSGFCFCLSWSGSRSVLLCARFLCCHSRRTETRRWRTVT